MPAAPQTGVVITGVKRDGSVTLNYSTDDGLVLGFIEHYHVITDDAKMLQWEVMRDAVPDDETRPLLPVNGLPLPGFTVSLDGYNVCKSLSGTRDEENPLHWVFTAEWSTKVDSNAGNDPTRDPTKQFVFREQLFEEVQRPRRVDYLGNTYSNGAGTLYNPPLVVDEELSRWDFRQIEPHFNGAPFGSTYQEINDPFIGSNGEPMPPGVYYSYGAGGMQFLAYTDRTIEYINGAVNFAPFLGRYPPFTLIAKVRSSKVFYINGVYRRVTDYTIIFDRNNHFDKPLNVGPYFIAPKLDDNGDDVAGETSLYPYVWHTKDVETDDTDIVVDEQGPLGSRNLLLQFNGTTGVVERNVQAADEDGEPSGGYVKVTAANGTKVYRAKQRPVGSPIYYHEFANHVLLNFSNFFRVY